jgi:hypothetical protein
MLSFAPLPGVSPVIPWHHRHTAEDVLEFQAGRRVPGLPEGPLASGTAYPGSPRAG